MSTEEIKAQLLAELTPLLHEAERTITSGNRPASFRVTITMLKLIGRYTNKLSREEIREVLNNPLATDILHRLGVAPPTKH